MVLLPWKWTSNWEIWGKWPVPFPFLFVQFNSNLLLGQASVHSVQWSMTRAKCLPSLSCTSTSVVAIWYDTIWINKIQYNWYDTIKELVQYDIWIGTIQDMNGYNTICKSVWYDIQIGTIRYSNQYDNTIYESVR